MPPGKESGIIDRDMVRVAPDVDPALISSREWRRYLQSERISQRAPFDHAQLSGLVIC
jgi:hypothetical protein